MSADPFAVVNAFTIVKECKGAALAILVLLAVNAQRGGDLVTQEWLERHSGYSDKPVAQALAYLCETGRLVETAAGYGLAEGSIWGEAFTGSLDAEQAEATTEQGAQPDPDGPLTPAITPASDASTGDVQAAAQVRPDPDDLRSEPAKPAQTAESSRKISDSPTTTTALNIESIKKEAEEEGATDRRAGKIPTQINLERVEANLLAFKKWGVGRNEKTIVISAREEVTPEQIEAIARQLIAERRFSTGLLVTAVQSGDQPVTGLPNKYAPRPKERDPAGYASWEE